MSAPLRRSSRLAAKKAAAAAEPRPTLEEWDDLLFAHETFSDLIESSRMPSSRKHAMLACAEFFEYATTQTAYLAYQPQFRAACCTKVDELTVEIEDCEPTHAALRLAAALAAFQDSIEAIYAHRLFRRL